MVIYTESHLIPRALYGRPPGPILQQRALRLRAQGTAPDEAANSRTQLGPQLPSPQLCGRSSRWTPLAHVL